MPIPPSIQALQRELRTANGDRSKLSNLHSRVTEIINRAYGEEKEVLQKLRQEIKNVLNCRMLDH